VFEAGEILTTLLNLAPVEVFGGNQHLVCPDRQARLDRFGADAENRGEKTLPFFSVPKAAI
jgi:hypothetical protein